MPQPTKKREGLDWSLLGPTEKPTASAPRAADGALNWSLLGRPVSAPANTAEGLIGRVLQPLPEPVEMTGPDLAELSLGTDFATAPDDEGRALVLSKRLPLANMTPEQVRDTATEAGLPPILLQERAAEARVNETLDLLRRYAPNVADRLEGTGRTWQDWAALLSQEEFVSRMERENPELAKRLKGLTVPRTARAATDPIRGDIGTTPAQRTFVEGTARTADVLATPLYVGEAIVGKGYRPRGAEALEVLEPPTSTAEAVGRGVAGLADTAVSMLAPSAPSAAAHALGGVARVLAPQRLKKAAQIAGGFGGFTAATAMPGVIAGEQSAGQAGVSALTALPHAVTEALRGAGMSGAVIMRAIDRGEISPDEVREAFRGLEPAVAIPALLKQLKMGKLRDEARLDRRLAESRIDEPAGLPPQGEPRFQITPEKRAAYERAVAEEKAGESGEPETQRATVVESLVEPVSKSLREQGYTVTVEPRGDRFEVVGTKTQPPKPPPSALTGAAAALKPKKGTSREAQEQEGNVDARRDTAGGGGVGRDVQRLPDAAQGQGQAEGQGPQGPPAEVLITAAQRKMIFALGRERGIDKAALSGMAPGGSIAKLTKPQAGELISRLQAMPKKAPQRPPPLQTKETRHAQQDVQAVGVHADVQQQPRAKAGAQEVPAEGRGARQPPVPTRPPAGETQAGSPRMGETQRTEDLNTAAQEAATSPTNALPQPTPAQQQAGNYRKGHVRFGGLDISIENPIGSRRSGIDKGGKPWSVTMSAHYGYVKGTRAKDGDHVDVYLSGKPSKHAPAYIIDQYNPETGKFDEHKIVLGVAEQSNALRVYDAHFSDGSGPNRRRAVTQVPMETFREWIEGGDTRRPASEVFSKSTGAEVTRLESPKEARAEPPFVEKNAEARMKSTAAEPRQPPALPTKALLEERQKVLDGAWEHIQSTGFDDFATRPERREYEKRLASLDRDLLERGTPKSDLIPLDRFIETRIMRRDSRTLAEQRHGTVVNLRPKEAPEPAKPGTKPAAFEGAAFSKPATYGGTKRIEVSHPDGKAGAWIERRKGESGWSVRLVDTVPQAGKAWPLNISQQVETNAPLNSAKAAAARATKEGFDRKKPIFNTYTYAPVSWSQVRPRSFPGGAMPGGTAFMGGRRRGGRPIRFYKVRSVGAAISDYFGWGGTAGRQLVELTKRVYSKAAEFKGPAVEEFNEIMRGENAAAQNRIVEIAGGHAKPGNPKEAAKAQAIKDLMQRQGELMEALDVRTAEGGRFRSLRDFVPGDLNSDYKRALLEGEKSGNPKFEEMVTRVVDALDRKGLEYVGGKIRKRESGGPRTPEQLRREALLWLRDWRSATLGEVRKPRDDPSPLDRFRRGIGEAGIEKSVQLHRLVDWPRHMLAENLADSVRRHLDRSARAIARRLVLGPRMEVPEKLIRQFYHDAITKAARRLNADPEHFVRDAEVYLRQLLADPLGRPDITGGHTTSFWRKTGRVLKGFANVGGVGLGTRMSLGVNQIWGLATTGLRFGYFRAMKHFLKNEKNFLLDVPVIGHRIKPTKAYQQALRRGALEGDTATMQLVNESALPESAKNVMMGFFAGHEAVIRSASAAAAVTWAKSRLPKIARVLKGAADYAHAKRLLRERADGRQLLEMGLDIAGIREAAQRGSFSESQMGQLMRGGVELTQPVFRSYSLPRFLQTEAGKFWLQFKAAAYRQTDATLGYVLREAGHRNYWPAMRFLVAAPILGISAQGIGRFLAGKKLLPDDEERWSYGVRLIGDTLGIVDMPIDLAEDVTRSKSGAELVGRSAPPSVGMAAEMLSAAYRSVKAMYRDDEAGAKRAARRSARSVGIGRLADRLIQAAGAPPISWTHELPYTESTADWDRAKRRFDAAYEPIRAAERLRSESRGVPNDPEAFDQAKREKATAAITEAIGSPERWVALKTELAGHRRIIAAAEKFMREKSREADAARSPESAAALRKRIDNAAIAAAKHYAEAEKLVRRARGGGDSRGFVRRVLEGSGAER